MRNGLRILSLGAALALWTGLAVDGNASTEVTLAFQGAVKGRIEDCGCPKNPLGGLAARAVLLETIRAEHPHLALLDAGNLMGAPTESGHRQSRFLAAETVALGYSVTGVGINDLRYGTAFLREIEREQGLQFTCANLYDGDEPLFSPYEVVEVAGVRIGVISVHDAGFDLTSTGEDESVAWRDPAASLNAWLPKLRAESDVVVLLSHVRPTDLGGVLGAIDAGQRIDFVIDGVGQAHLARPKSMGSTTYLAANDQGKYLGQLNFTVENDGSIANVGYSLHEVGPDPEDEDVASRVAAFKQQEESLVDATPIHQ